MSTLISQARVKAPRIAEAALERARLTVVPARTPRAAKAPFAILVMLLLAGGVVGLLMFNTQMQQDSFRMTALQRQADDLKAQRQQLEMDLDRLRNPQHLAQAAKRMGMVAPSVPAFVDLATGRVIGKPVPATAADGIRIESRGSAVPSVLRPTPITVTVPAPPQPQRNTTTSSASGGPASAISGTGTGRKNQTNQTGSATTSQGATR